MEKEIETMRERERERERDLFLDSPGNPKSNRLRRLQGGIFGISSHPSAPPTALQHLQPLPSLFNFSHHQNIQTLLYFWFTGEIDLQIMKSNKLKLKIQNFLNLPNQIGILILLRRGLTVYGNCCFCFVFLLLLISGIFLINFF